MKILHTSDWHLGQVLYNYNRSEEQANFFEQLTAIVAQEKPDALVVSGDIYHTSLPTVGNQKMYTDGVLSLHEAHPEMQIVITAGNHDGRSRLEIDSPLWSHFKVSVIGNLQYTEDGRIDYDRHIVRVTNSAGAVAGYIAAVPFEYPQNFPMEGDESKEDRQRAFFSRLLARVGTLNEEGLPVVLMAHLTITGCDVTGHDDGIAGIGGLERTDVGSLGRGYDYLALGHIHRPQNIPGDALTRYCGSPIPVSFDENYEHSVTVVEMEKGMKPAVRTIVIKNLLPLLTVPETPKPFEEALQALANLPKEQKGYLRVNVLIGDGNLPGNCNERILEAVRDKNIRFCYINRNVEEAGTEQKRVEYGVDEVQSKSPLDIAEQYYRETYQREMGDELKSMMADVVKDTLKKNHQNM